MRYLPHKKTIISAPSQTVATANSVQTYGCDGLKIKKMETEM